MLFNSWTFWVFLGVVLPVYWLLPFRPQTIFILVASYFFYGSWNWRYLPLIALSTLMDFSLGRLVGSASSDRVKRRYVIVSIIVNLLLLGTFKYYDFFASQVDNGLGAIGVQVSLPLLHLLLPVGISFYTFQSMSYVFDIARGITSPAKNFWNFALYVSFFPHLVAGPIMRSGAKGQDAFGRGLLTQLEAPRQSRPNDFAVGLYHVIIGLFKKIAIGDNLAALVDMVFSHNVQNTGIDCLLGVYAFAWQIYADFSGYSSIAQGVAKWMGIDLIDNFKAPYIATSPSDFWRRWHISLSTWLRDYLYIPLGGNRGGERQTIRNLLTTMLLGGLWHGANWTFLFWGLYHGLLLWVYRAAELEKQPASGAERALRIVVTFHLVCFGWLLFRADSMEQAGNFLYLMATDWHTTPNTIPMLGLIAFYSLPLFAFEYWASSRGENIPALVAGAWGARAGVYCYAVMMLLFFQPPNSHDFIYFQF
jgi:alginate O-acetyltransferase complex protein AlgI